MPRANGVQCSSCNNISSHTTDSRPHPIGRRRRYICRTCKESFGTIEIVLPPNVKLYKLKRVKSAKELLALIIQSG